MTMIAYEAHRILDKINGRIAYHKQQRDRWCGAFEDENRKAGLPEGVTDTRHGHYEHARMFEHVHALWELFAVRNIIEAEIESAEMRNKFEMAGYKAGRAAGSLVIDGNSHEETKHRMVVGIESGDPAILDQLPDAHSRLDGTWADELSWPNVWVEISECDPQDFPDDGDQEMYVEYVSAFDRGVQDQVLADAKGWSTAAVERM